MTTPQAERRITRACAIFSVTDSFVTLRGVDGAGLARQARGPVTFQLTGIGSGPARRSIGTAIAADRPAAGGRRHGDRAGLPADVPGWPAAGQP